MCVCMCANFSFCVCVCVCFPPLQIFRRRFQNQSLSLSYFTCRTSENYCPSAGCNQTKRTKETQSKIKLGPLLTTISFHTRSSNASVSKQKTGNKCAVRPCKWIKLTMRLACKSTLDFVIKKYWENKTLYAGACLLLARMA
jgi:hypothetical protein